MTQSEREELVDLYIDGELPEALRAFTESYLTAHPEAAADSASLQETARRLSAFTPEKADDWFIERALDRLLREHATAQEIDPEFTVYAR